MAHFRSQIARDGETAAFGLVVFIAVLCPLPFGSNGPESTMVLVILAGLSLVLASLSLIAGGTDLELRPTPALMTAFVLFALFGLWGLVQVIPGLPAPLSHPLWNETAAILGPAAVHQTISIDPQLTWAALAKTGAYFCVGIATIILLRQDGRRRLLTTAMAGAGALYAVYALAELFAGDCCVLWEEKTAYLGVATGPFINRNNFATYLGLIALVALAHILREIGELRHERRAGRPLMGLGMVLRRRSIMIASCAVTVTTLLFTLSRGGIASSILGAGVLVALASEAGVIGRRRIASVAIYSLCVLTLLMTIGGSFLGRLADDGIEDAARAQSYSVMWTEIEASPLLGDGFGTFPEAFPLHRDDRLVSRRIWDKAQNTYLELSLDMGLPATILFLGGYIALAIQLASGLRRRRVDRRIFPALGLGATALIAAHSLVDFSMQIPAVATTFALIAGICVSESGIWRSREGSA